MSITNRLALSKCQFIVYNQFGTDPLIYQCLLNPASFDYAIKPVYDGIGAAGLPGQQQQYVRNDSEEITFTIFLHIDTRELIYRNKYIQRFEGIKVNENNRASLDSEFVSSFNPRSIHHDIAFFRSLCYPDIDAWLSSGKEPNTFIRSPIIDFVKGFEVYHGVVSRMTIKETMQNELLEPVEATIDITMNLTVDSFDRIQRNFNAMSSARNVLFRR